MAVLTRATLGRRRVATPPHLQWSGPRRRTSRLRLPAQSDPCPVRLRQLEYSTIRAVDSRQYPEKPRYCARTAWRLRSCSSRVYAKRCPPSTSHPGGRLVSHGRCRFAEFVEPSNQHGFQTIPFAWDVVRKVFSWPYACRLAIDASVALPCINELLFCIDACSSLMEASVSARLPQQSLIPIA